MSVHDIDLRTFAFSAPLEDELTSELLTSIQPMFANTLVVIRASLPLSSNPTQESCFVLFEHGQVCRTVKHFPRMSNKK